MKVIFYKQFFVSALLALFSLITISAVKIDRVIISTDTNPTYSEFWPIVAKAWDNLIGIKPTLVFIADKNVPIETWLGDVIYFEPVPGIPTGFQAQVIRLLIPVLFENEVCLISDIDMIPLNKQYFIGSAAQVPDDKFVVYRDKAYDGNRFPMCYLAAKGSIFKEIFHMDSLEDVRTIIKEWYKLGLGWDTDEIVLFQYLNTWKDYQSRCVKLGHKVERRLDRSYWAPDIGLLRRGYYIDAHSIRPYSQYKQEIDKILRILHVIRSRSLLDEYEDEDNAADLIFNTLLT